MLFLFALTSAIAAPVDTTYQGRLTDALGAPVNGSQSVTLTIYDDPDNGTLVDTLPLGSITFADGYFATVLQDADSAWFDGDHWVEFTVGGQTLNPRQPLVSGVGGGSIAPSGTSTDPATSCKQLHADRPGLSSGEYTMDPNGDGTNLITVFCDMDTAGGGWTLVTRASDTNGVGNDYEFRAAVGANSVLDLTTSVGTPSSAQYLLALQDVLPPEQAHLQVMYLCYDSRDRASTEFWAHTGPLDAVAIAGDSGLPNADKLYPTGLVNSDGDRTGTGNFALFRRDGANSGPECGNGHAGQSGLKFSCSYSGQTAMAVPGV